MRLIHWWPLNKDCNDYGFNKILSETNNMQFNSNGKIGAAAVFNGNDSYIKINNLAELHNLNKYTMACWVYLTSVATNHSSTFLSSGDWNKGSLQVCFAVYDFDNNKQQYNRLLCPNPTGWSIGILLPEEYRIKLNKWYHIAITYDGINTKAYINGQYVNSISTGGINLTDKTYYYLGAATYYHGFTLNGNLTDFRIYDYNLSAKEIKDLYYTKVVHFKFNDKNEEPTINILNYDGTFDSFDINSDASFTNQLKDENNGILKVTNYCNKKCLKVYSSDSGARAYRTTPLKKDKRYALSADIFSLSTSVRLRYELFGGDYHWDANNAFHHGQGWERLSLVTPVLTSDTKLYEFIYPGANNIIYVKNIQVEEKDHSTAFCPKERLINITDNSEFHNNGVVPQDTQLIWQNDTCIGEGSFKFNGNTIISHPNPFLGQDNKKQEWTVCAWVKIDEESPGYTYLNNFNSGNRLIHSTTPLLYLNSGSHDYYIYGQLLPKNEWFHIAFVFRNNDGYRKIYLNGTDISTHGPNKDNTPSGIPNIIKIGQNLKGAIADYRIYAVALQAEDIQNLYKVKAAISKNGKFFINEINEQTETLMNTKDLTIGNLTTTNISISKINNQGERIITSDTSGSFRMNLPFNNIEPFGNKDLIFSFNYIILQGDTFSATDWCDGHIDTYKTNYFYAISGKRASYTSVYHFVDFVISANTKVLIKNIKLYPGNIEDIKKQNSITKQSQLYCNEINELDSLSFQTKNFDNADWIRIFYHNCKNGTVLFSSDYLEFLKCNTGDKISDLWALEQFRGQDGKFELLLQYPNDTPTQYNRWKQSSNFTKEKVSGYEPIHIDWSTQNWGGLEFNSTGPSWADGSANHNYWFYAIGSKTKFGIGIPNSNASTDNIVELWIRCDKPETFKFYKNRTIQSTEFIEN